VVQPRRWGVSLGGGWGGDMRSRGSTHMS
jgi:hypothetical protein